MKVRLARDVGKARLKKFLHRDMDEDLMMQSGYVVEDDDRLEGCFVLEEIDEGYWLRHLHVTEEAVPSLPVLLEGILTLAAERQASDVYVYSHNDSVDTLLEALQFMPRNSREAVDNSGQVDGKWWIYHVT